MVLYGLTNWKFPNLNPIQNFDILTSFTDFGFGLTETKILKDRYGSLEEKKEVWPNTEFQWNF